METLSEHYQLYLLETRLKTYSNWPFQEDCLCTPHNMAIAGFVHCPSENSPDVAQCFFCFKELEGWEPDDNPMQEHKKHSSKCAFISLQKKIEDLTLEELLRLDRGRMKNMIEKRASEAVAAFQERVKYTREFIENLGSA
ncbi:baculoviral IAP repeat-containing protein 5a [Latimeria chalumnae]|uniref:Baculoviral IAP repeat containing 5 n=1 Tax=Latimeria chalumnae TaxID=7897 RepID=H3BDV3_LATCH|nr:PREDICTED: baculoviral IAP repeat-containing protein 5 [Latimeria chalumnae]|eukprot:XP_005989156.1 PREDICTED: baculoviral IAP repeat-containing protein 5 [Latimeria chalumnae]